ncbi:MAG: hypothetical protein K8T25_00670 [Planctomycetia bacterium]|nr:hypothetical protein [Planctomycetia bacterium]
MGSTRYRALLNHCLGISGCLVFAGWLAPTMLQAADNSAPPAAVASAPIVDGTSVPRAASTSEALQARIATLVQNLGDPEFAIRQKASRDLEALGPVTKSALLGALQSQDAEVRYRAQRILVSVLEADFQARLQAFVADSDGSQSPDLPCWKTFSAMAGKSSQARQLFAEAVRAEPLLLETVEQNSSRAADAIANRCDSLIASLARQRSTIGRFSEPQSARVPLGKITALMLAVCVPNVSVSDAEGIRIYQLFHQSQMVEELSGGAKEQPARRLLGGWIERTAGGNLAFQSMWLGMRYDLKEGLVPAEILIKRTDQQPYVRQLAILAIGKLGTRSNTALLEPLLKDTTSCDPNQEAQTRAKFRCELRDVALASIIHLHGKNPKDFGFERIATNPQTLYVQNTMGFADEAHRKAAADRWQSWVQQQPAATPSVPVSPGSGSTAPKGPVTEKAAPKAPSAFTPAKSPPIMRTAGQD